MARFDLIDEYTSIALPGTRKAGRYDWPERFEDSHPALLQESGKAEKSMILRDLSLFAVAGTFLSLIRKASSGGMFG